MRSFYIGSSSFWVRIFDAARRTDDWVRVPRFYTRATAAQLASDITNSHRRDLDSLRVKGIVPGEVWEARWNTASDGPKDDHVVWIRLVSPAPR
ncbi:MAG: hypothetical protein ACO3AV_05515 [Ilumatobacteraceae bacterium]